MFTITTDFSTEFLSPEMGLTLGTAIMDGDQDLIPGAQSPIESTPARTGSRSKVAAGLPAVYQTLRFSLREMGPIRAIRTLLSVNKKGGFDCQSCAWPSPDKDRKVAEFCENGAKAIADEATTKRLTEDF